MRGFYFLVSLFLLCCLADVFIAAKGFQRGGEKGRALGAACVGAAVVTASYTASLFATNYRAYSVLSSLYFGGIDFTLLATLILNWRFINASNPQPVRWWHKVLCAYGALDMLFFAVNPFWEISIGYRYNGGSVACFSYEIHLLYWLHLAFSYLLIAMILVELVHKSVSAPRIYARQYMYSSLSLCLVVLVNAFYLYLPDAYGENRVDLSLLGYSCIAFSYYWFCYKYPVRGLLNHFHSWIFENIDEGLVLFNSDDRLLLHNQKAEKMLPGELLRENTAISSFLTGCGVCFGAAFEKPSYVFQCFVKGRALRCDYSMHLDGRGRKLGSLFVFSDVSTQYDLLTGFHTWTDFKENAHKLVPANVREQVVVTFDVNSLRDINSTYGRACGDRVLQLLAEEMRRAFPGDTVFTRSREASFAAITMELNQEQVKQIAHEIQENMQHHPGLEIPVQLQSAVSVRGQEGVADTIRQNLQSMRTKKLMDKSSLHSEVLGSLLQALTQCDPDTGEHVRRTQKSGEALGRRLNLSDRDLSNLALLAILHDIGKIGIPLEILNKPGKLNDAEWRMMQTHVQKGYQIAISSKEFSGIAEMILYHHERWDGHGYPNGLRGEQIPLLSRIIAVVDAYDAMTNDRAYRKALLESAARTELLRGAGSQFDPNVVREFLAMLEENDRKRGVEVALLPQAESKEKYGTRPSSHARGGNVQPVRYSIYYIDWQMRIVQTDDNFEAITGYSRTDVAEGKLTQLSLMFPEDVAEYQSYVQPDGRTQDTYLHHRIRRKDGTAAYVNCYGHDFFDSSVGENRARIVIVNSEDLFRVQKEPQ